MNEMREPAGSRDAWSRASRTASELHAEWGTAVPLTYFVVWLAGGFVIALFIGWVTASYALWRVAGGTLQIFGVTLIALHMMKRKRRSESRLQQLALEIRMLWRNVVSRDPATQTPLTADGNEVDVSELQDRLATLEAAVIELRREMDTQYVGPLSGLRPPRAAVDRMARAHERRPGTIQLQWVGFGWILLGLVLATWS